MKKTFLKTLISMFVISAILGIFIILLDLWNETTSKILLSTIFIFLFSIPALACSASYEKFISIKNTENKKFYNSGIINNEKFAIGGIISCFISCIYFLLLIWKVINFSFFDDFIWKIIWSCVLISLSFGHISLISLVVSDNKNVNYFKDRTIILSLILDALLLTEIIGEISINWRFIAILAILVALGTIITPLSNKLNSKSHSKPVNNQNNKYKELEQIKKLLDDNAITQEEYDQEKAKILNS